MIAPYSFSSPIKCELMHCLAIHVYVVLNTITSVFSMFTLRSLSMQKVVNASRWICNLSREYEVSKISSA